MGRFVDRIRARREMENNPITISIDTDKVNEMTERMQPPTFVSDYKFDKPTERPQQIQDWQKYGFKSQDDMNFWVNRAKSWSGGVLDTIDKVKQFQRKNGLVDDGKVGWRTIDVFNRINGAGSKRFSNNPSKVYTPDAMPKSSNPEERKTQPTQAENPRVQDAENAIADDVVMPENTINFLGHSLFTTPLSMGKKTVNNNQAKTPTNNNQTNTNNEPDNTEYPILSNQWFANVFSSLSNQNLKKVGRDIINLIAGQSNTDASKNNEINKDFYKNQFNEIIDLARRMGESRRMKLGNGSMYLHKKGGTIRRFQQGGELTPNDIESRLQYYSRIGYPVDGRIGDVNIGTISGEVPYTKYNAQTVKGANGMEMGQSDGNMKFIQYVKDCIGVQDDNSLKQAIRSLGEKGIKALQQAYRQGIPAQQVRKQLMGQQAQYAKRGGCLACQKNGGRFAKPSKPELQKANAKANVNQMPVLVNSMKCGGKAGKKMLSKKRK